MMITSMKLVNTVDTSFNEGKGLNKNVLGQNDGYILLGINIGR